MFLKLSEDEEDMPDEVLGRKITRRTPKILDDALTLADYVAKRKTEGASMKEVIQEIKGMKK